MKNILVVFIFFSVILYGQEENNSSSIVDVTLKAFVEKQTQDITELNENLLLTLSELNSLRILDFTINNGKESLTIEMIFGDMQSFLKWYKAEETQKLFAKIEKNYNKSTLNIKFTK